MKCLRHVFILNPAAGKRNQTPELTAQIHTLFSGGEEPYLILTTQYAGHAGEIARHYAQDGVETTLYACGGDGTLGEVAQVLPDNPQLILAPVPVGTGNDFVRTLTQGYTTQPVFTLPKLRTGQVVPCDLLRAGRRVSLNIASVGLDATIAQNVGRFKNLPAVSGDMAYTLSMIYCFFSAVKYRFRFEIDGELCPPGDVIFAIAANGTYYGGGFKAAPLADVQDGLIDFIRVPSLSRLRILPMISHYKRGEHLSRYPFIELVRCKQVRILSDKPVALNCDGEIALEQNPSIAVLPAAARILVPSDFAKHFRRD